MRPTAVQARNARFSDRESDVHESRKETKNGRRSASASGNTSYVSSRSPFVRTIGETGLPIDRGVSTLRGLPIHAALAAGSSTMMATASRSLGTLREHVAARQTVYVEEKIIDGYVGIKGKVLNISDSTLRLLVDGRVRELSEGDVRVVSDRP